MVFRIGLVGAGRMGLTHFEALRHESRVAITAIAEPRESVRRDLSGLGVTVVPTVDELTRLGTIDGFLVSTPSGTHREVVEQLAQTGKPILCEKPAGLTVGDAEAIKAACLASGSRLQIGYWRRFIPSLRAVRRSISDGDFGRVLLVSSNQWDHEPPSAQFRNNSGGIARDMGVHEIDVIRWISGQEVVSISEHRVMSTESGVHDEEAATLQLELSGGALGLATLGRYFPDSDFVECEVLGVRHRTRMAVLSPRKGTAPQMHALRRQARAFARGNDAHAASIDDALAVLRVLEQNRTTQS